MKIEIVPAILETSFTAIEQRIKTVSGFADWVQIDLCDGIYIPQKTWLPNDTFIEKINEEGMPGWEDVDFEFDLMVQDYKKYIEYAKDLGAARIVCHLDTIENVRIASEICRGYDIAFGLSCGSIDVLKVAIEEVLVDYIQVMGIETIGLQGQGFSECKLEYIKAIANILKEQNEERVIIQVDGGMTDESIKACKDAGASRFAVGSYLFKYSGSVEERYKQLLKV